MVILLKLYLAHLIADFTLQFSVLFRLKLKSVLGHILHAVIHAVVSLFLLFPYLREPFIWGFVVVISAIHFFQDMLKYKITGRTKYFFLIFVADQIFHFLFLTTILFFPISEEVRGFPAAPFLGRLYTENQWTLYLILFLVATVGGSFLLHAFSISYRKDARKDQFITPFEIIHGIFERSIIAGVFLMSASPVAWILCLGVGIVRLFFKRVQNKMDFVMSFIYGAGVGLLFRLWI